MNGLDPKRDGWNNNGLACDFARNLAKQGIATWSDVTEWGTGEVLTWLQMKRVYGLRDNTTEHSEYKRLAEQLMRPVDVVLVCLDVHGCSSSSPYCHAGTPFV